MGAAMDVLGSEIEGCSPPESDMAVTLLVRNRSAHDVTMDPVLRERAGEVEEHIHAAIFGAAEHLQ